MATRKTQELKTKAQWDKEFGVENEELRKRIQYLEDQVKLLSEHDSKLADLYNYVVNKYLNGGK